MATPQTMWVSFESVQKSVVDHFKLNGYVIKEYDCPRDRVLLFYHFDHNYLKIRDYVCYERYDLNETKVFDDMVKLIKDIEYQFRFYFGGVWG